MEVEFSLRGLSELLEKKGLRVVAGNEGKYSYIARSHGNVRMIYRVEEIDLTVTLERPFMETDSSQGQPPTKGEEKSREKEELEDLTKRLEERRPYGTD
jgi:hypothetical protein